MQDEIISPDREKFCLKVASYNIHGGVGIDRHFVPNRIVDVLREIDADVVALQEVESRTTGFDMLEFLAERLSYQAIPGPTLIGQRGDYGNGLLTRLPVTHVHRLDLSIPGREARGAIDVKLQRHTTAPDTAGEALRVVATHLGLHPAERRSQVQRLLALFESDRNLPTIFMGDVNEWFLVGRPLRWLHRHFMKTPAPATFPTRFPVFALDRIWVHPATALVSVYAHASPIARCASDHLPVVGAIEIECGPTDRLPSLKQGRK